MPTRLIPVDDGLLEVRDEGAGEPVVFIQTALATDELFLVGAHPAIRERHRVVHIIRRGYGQSTPPRGIPSIAGDAQDAIQVIAALELHSAHLVGVSYSAAVALEAAATTPGAVRTLTLVEPPPADVPLASEFREAGQRLLDLAQDSGPMATVDALMTALDGPDWRRLVEERQSGELDRIEQAAAAFVGSDMPAVLNWSFDEAAATRVSAPTLLIGGGDTEPWFAQTRSALLQRLPDVREVVVPGAGHLIAVSHPDDVAPTLAAFVAQHASGG